MASLALAFDILARDKGASRTFDQVGDSADRAGKKGKGFGLSMKGGLGLAAGAVAAAGLGSMFTGFIKDAAESARIGRLTAAAVKSTGGVAKVSVDQVNALATAISNKTAVDDEAIQSGANMLLTFTKVRNETGKGNDIFNQATQAAVDMSAALGTDVKGASLQLGKALNDPIKGVGALSRAGVSFTKQQKDQIKTLVESGDVLGAQKIILGEMQTQFGGAAAAAADPLARLQVIAGNLGEKVGGLLLPYVERFATFVSDKAIPAIEGFIGGMKDGTGAGGAFVGFLKGIWAVVQPVAQVLIGTVVPAVQRFFAAFQSGGGPSQIRANLQTLVAFIQTQVVPAAMSIVASVRQFVAVALPIVQQFVAGMRARIEPMMPQIRAVFTTIGQIVVGVMGLISAVISRVTQVISAIWSRWGSNIMDLVSNAFRTVTGIIGGALKVVQGVIKTVTSLIKGDWSGAWNGIKTIFSGVWQVIRSIVTGAMGQVKAVVGDGIKNVITTVRGLPGKARSALSDLGSTLYSAGARLVQGLIDGIASKIQAVKDKVASVAQAVKDFFPGSPVKEGPLRAWNNGAAGKRLGDMLASGLDSSRLTVAASSRRLAASVVTPTASGSGQGGAGVGGRLDLSDATLYRLAAILQGAPLQAKISAASVDAALAVGL